MVFDAHSDLLYDVTRRRLLGERRVLELHHICLLYTSPSPRDRQKTCILSSS